MTVIANFSQTHMHFEPIVLFIKSFLKNILIHSFSHIYGNIQ